MHPDKNELSPRWCLVGNIIDQHPFGEQKELLTGSKHFRPGAKVYIAPLQWGDGGESVVVIGIPRHRKDPIEIVMRGELITNHRLKRVYSPVILKRMNKSPYFWWDDTDKSKEQIQAYIESIHRTA